jgi:methyl-accepting chemotaxis protein
MAIGFAAPILMMVIVCGVTFTLLSNIRGQQKRLTEVRFPTALHAETAYAGIYEAMGAARCLRDLQHDQTAEMTRCREELAEGFGFITSSMEGLEAVRPLWTVQQTKDRYARLAEVVPAMLGTLEGGLSATGPEARQKLAAAVDKAYPISREARELLQGMIKTQKETIPQDVAAVTADMNRISAVVVGSTVAAGILAGLIGWHLTRRMLASLRPIMNQAEQIALGHLGEPALKVVSKDELGELTESVNKMHTGLRNLVAEAIQTATEVAATATEVAASAEEMTQGLTQQSVQLRDVTDSVSTLSTSAATIAQDTQQAAQGAKATEAAGDQGSRSVRAAIEQMNEIKQSVSGTAQVIESLGKRSETIGDIIAIINDIADQTNLLALNAAIEAARAGEHGRGFAVVADEVRKLADRTTKATGEISQSISQIRTESAAAIERVQTGAASVQDGVAKTNIVSDGLTQIVAQAQSLATMVERVNSATTSQQESFERISRSCAEISAIGEQSASASTESAAAAAQLSAKAEALQAVVNRFTLERRHHDIGPGTGQKNRRTTPQRHLAKLA